MTMTKRKMQNAIDKYNELMYRHGHDWKTVGTSDSADTEDWGLVDMIDECEYCLGCYSDPTHCFYEDLHCLDDGYRESLEREMDDPQIDPYYRSQLEQSYRELSETVKTAKRDMRDLQKFIRKYSKEI